jgi:hypothetical protein
MTGFIAWCGFFGGWLLVAGPFYQAAIELREESFEREAFEEAAANVPQPVPPSNWWWLLPPVYYLIARRRGSVQREAIMARLTKEQLDDLYSFMSKARGWVIVGMGALLIATKETWELSEHYEWSDAIFVALWVVMVLIAFGSTSLRLSRDSKYRKTYSARGA